MVVTAWWFAGAVIQAFDKEIDYLADTIKAALTSSSYTPNQDTHDYFDDVTNELSTANGYTAGGDTVASKTNSNTNNVASWGHDDPAWTSSGGGFTARRMVTYNSTPGSASTNPLLWWMDFGQDETASGGGAFTVNMASSVAATATATDATGYP